MLLCSDREAHEAAVSVLRVVAQPSTAHERAQGEAVVVEGWNGKSRTISTYAVEPSSAYWDLRDDERTGMQSDLLTWKCAEDQIARRPRFMIPGATNQAMSCQRTFNVHIRTICKVKSPTKTTY